MISALRRLQGHLNRLYDGTIEPQVESYLIGPEQRAEMPGAHLELDEQLFVGGDASDVGLSLYLAPRVLRELAAADPWRRLLPAALPSFLLAIEGVSHFLMVAWRAGAGAQVSALELELQAEVDKFLVVGELWARQADNPLDALRQLWRHLFVAPSLQPATPADQHERYRLASAAAGAFCLRLLAAGPAAFAPSALTRAARRFVRRPLADKLRR